jgi:hypothetical protein
VALSPKDALEAVKTVLESHRLEEASRLQGIADALDTSANRPIRIPVAIPDDAPPLMRELAGGSRRRIYLPLLVKTFSQVMKVDGYQTVEPTVSTDPWVWWQRNRMDSRQTGMTRSSAVLRHRVRDGCLPASGVQAGEGPAISLLLARGR